MSANDQNSRDTLSLLRELPYFRLNVNLAHGQFNNCLPSHLPAKKYFTILSVMTAVTFPLRPPRLAFPICGRRWQNYVYENKVQCLM